MIGLVVQVALLGALAAAADTGPMGALAGAGYGLITCAALTLGLRRSGAPTLGPADKVTLTRATLVGGVAALTVDSFHRHVPVPLLVGLASVALLLDAVDGPVARRSGTVSALGARFDMEVDAFLILVLSVYATRLIGAWTLVIGAMRYAFLAAGWALPWLRGSLPFRYWRKVVAATQGIVLVFASADLVPRPLSVAVVAAALALLAESFGRDVWWLWRHRTRTDDAPTAGAPTAGAGTAYARTAAADINGPGINGPGINGPGIDGVGVDETESLTGRR
ncbi:hypothetical protein GCM10023322_45970 [Rugosimonospora acidiphila]|uniref:Phosphatidylglycerophosphate synthase n=1 Tax=Rugosimonospora acidiphila TaxID=556531 RepID=A0ABP9S3W3_9ACTN